MATQILTGEKAEEYKRLYLEFGIAVAHATAVLRTKGMDSEELSRADAATGALWRRLRELQGMAEAHITARISVFMMISWSAGKRCVCHVGR